MKPVFVDVQPKTYNLDPNKSKPILRHAPGPSSRPSHGLPADMAPILDIARRTICASSKTLAKPCSPITADEGWLLERYRLLFDLYRSLHRHGRRRPGHHQRRRPGNSSEELDESRDAIRFNLTIDDDANCTQEKLFEIAARRFPLCFTGTQLRCTELEAAIGPGSAREKDVIVARRKSVQPRIPRSWPV